jgi:hypothetical protein|nr:MAG TPA: hypothetical protein [Caudoviricetes sp.]
MRKFAVVEKQFQYKGHDCICVFNRMKIDGMVLDYG